jgi:ADP-dependent NAD(P)H-hydrate dehydratase
MSTPAEPITPAGLRDWPLPAGGGSKHSRGHLVVIGGSSSTPGAVLLAGLAALRVGAGVLALAVPEQIAIPLAIAVPEAGVTPLNGDLAGIVGQADAVLIGPGIDNPDDAKRVLQDVVSALGDDTSVVLDAYALGVLPQLGELAKSLAGRLILTPNSSEADRLLDGDGSGERGHEAALEIAKKWQAIVSYQSVIASPDGTVRQVMTGHAGLGTSGSGDVLAGAVVGLLARGASLDQAASWGTYLHAAAGDRLAARVGRLGFLARELLDELPLVLTELQS